MENLLELFLFTLFLATLTIVHLFKSESSANRRLRRCRFCEHLKYRFGYIQTQWDRMIRWISRSSSIGDVTNWVVLWSYGIKINDCSDLKRLQRGTEMACVLLAFVSTDDISVFAVLVKEKYIMQ